jgi:hypothetical protein
MLMQTTERSAVTRKFSELKQSFQKVVRNDDVWDEYFDTLIKQGTKSDDEKKEIVNVLLDSSFESTKAASCYWHINIKRWDEVFKRLTTAQLLPLLPADLGDRLTDLSLMMLEKSTLDKGDNSNKAEWQKHWKYFADKAVMIAQVMPKPSAATEQTSAQPDAGPGAKQAIRVRIIDTGTPPPPGKTP